MVWPFQSSSNPSNQNSTEENDVLESLDPSLKSFYSHAEPVKPVSLAPKEIKERIELDQKRKVRIIEEGLVPFEKGEVNGARRNYDIYSPDFVQTLYEAANENCALFAAKYSQCQRGGPMWSVMTACYKESQTLAKCLKIQKQSLEKAGYNIAIDNDQRREIKYALDDLYTLHFPDGAVTDKAKAAFYEDVEKLRIKQKEKTFRAY